MYVQFKAELLTCHAIDIDKQGKDMMRNLAGHQAMLFLFRFELQGNGVSFVLNEGIAEDMYSDISERLHPLVHACCETLSRYRSQCKGTTIMDGHLLLDGDFEVMLFPGLGSLLARGEKQALFQDAHAIALLLLDVMERREKEAEEGDVQSLHGALPELTPAIPFEGLEALGKKKQQRNSGFEPTTIVMPLSPDDLPEGVIAQMSYDHRGYCIGFTHKAFGYIGKLVAYDVEGETRIVTEVFNNDKVNFGSNQRLMEAILLVITGRFDVKEALRQEDSL